jgi:5-methylcytosine-specific restriction enzyme A
MPRVTMLRPPVALAKLSAVRTLTVGGSQRLRGREMSRLKAQVRRRSGGYCECSQCARLGQRLPADEFDHIVPLWEGGGDGLDNLAHLNRDCHKRKTRADERRRLGLDPDP